VSKTKLSAFIPLLTALAVLCLPGGGKAAIGQDTALIAPQTLPVDLPVLMFVYRLSSEFPHAVASFQKRCAELSEMAKREPLYVQAYEDEPRERVTRIECHGVSVKDRPEWISGSTDERR
jgi:hypothetical protein